MDIFFLLEKSTRHTERDRTGVTQGVCALIRKKKKEGVQSGTHNHKIRNYPTLHTVLDLFNTKKKELKKPSIVPVLALPRWFDLSVISTLSMPLTMMTIFQLLGTRSYPLSRPLWRGTCLEEEEVLYRGTLLGIPYTKKTFKQGLSKNGQNWTL